MANQTAAGAIQGAATDYQHGDENFVNSHLRDNVQVVGSEKGEHWKSREAARPILAAEMQQIKAETRSVGGPLVEAAKAVTAGDVTERGNIAWWAETGEIDLKAPGDAVPERHEQATWTVALEQIAGDWKIVHSHFSIHR